MVHLDLFSGIGGFAYAADTVFGDVTHIFCDNDKFCQAVLRKHWPESEIFDDIRTITADTKSEGLERSDRSKPKRGRASRRNTWPKIDILTGGFPCQPFSAAGLRRGTADERHLWPEMYRVIQLTRPTWVIAENVRGLLTWNDGLVLEQVCADLEAAGYEVQPLIIPAVAVNAPHRRDRIWFIANYTGERSDDRLDNREERRSWSRDWHEVAAEFCSVDDGLPVALDGFELSKSQHRKEQLKAYGNAIVPQVAMSIMEAMR